MEEKLISVLLSLLCFYTICPFILLTSVEKLRLGELLENIVNNFKKKE